MKKRIEKYQIPILMFAAFVVWIFALRGFVFGKLALMADAYTYFDHTRFFIEGLKRGVYPFWDPNWHMGIPSEFFMRRIGEFNPIYYSILILRFIGFSIEQAYLIFLVGYYFLGMIGFYLISKMILKNKLMAFLAFLLLTFSSLSTQLFFSYIILIFTPMIWFFTFLFWFSRKQTRFHFLGIIFTLMILVTTYIPFYFFTILLTFLICAAVFYFSGIKLFIRNLARFIDKNKLFTSLCLAALLISFIPGFQLFIDGKKNEIVMPQRSADSAAKSAFTVSQERNFEGGILFNNVWEDLHADLRDFALNMVYVPVFALILFLLGMFTTANRKILFILLWAGLIFLIGLSDVTPVYPFLFKAVFFFKYFRNLHFFFWWLLLPLFVLLIVEQLKNFMAFKPKGRLQIITVLAVLICSHIGLAVYLSHFYPLITTYLTIVLSFLFFIVHIFDLNERMSIKKDALLPITFLLLISIQALEVYHYLNRNSPKASEIYINKRNSIYEEFSFPNIQDVAKKVAINKSNYQKGYKIISEHDLYSIWVGLKWNVQLMSRLNPDVFKHFPLSKLSVYDETKWIEDTVDYEALGKDILNIMPTEVVTNQINQIDVIDSSHNHLVLETSFKRDKFIVFNDNYHPRWNVFLNGKEAELKRTFVAFKGVSVPAGEQTVEFRYGNRSLYLSKYGMMILFLVVFLYLITLGFQQNSQREKLNG